MPAHQTPLARILTTQAQGSGPTNQDRIRVLPNAVLVLDGASSPDPEPADGGTYATALADQLVDALQEEPADDLADLLEASIDWVRRELDLTPGQAPSSTVSIVRWTPEHLEVLVLGDTPVVIYGDRRLHVLKDDRLSHIATAERLAYKERLRGGHGYDQQHQQLMRRVVEVERQQRNQDGGYWIAEGDPRAAHHALLYKTPIARVRRALIATDGISRGIAQHAAVIDWQEALRMVEEKGIEALGRRVRLAEQADPDGRWWPRGKLHDDQSLVLVQFHQADCGRSNHSTQNSGANL